MDDLDLSVQPQCPKDHVVMRDVDTGWECPECGLFEPTMSGPMPRAFDGDALFGG